MSQSQMMKAEKGINETALHQKIDDKSKKAVLTSGETASKRSSLLTKLRRFPEFR